MKNVEIVVEVTNLKNINLKVYKIGICFILFFSYFISLPQVTQAKGMFNFTVEPILPKNQDLSTKGYFKLQSTPNSTQTIQLKVTNITNSTQELDVSGVNALTTKNGGIDYTVETKTEYTSFLDESFAIKDWLQSDNKLILKPNQSALFPVTIKIPNVSKGTYLGAIMFSPKVEKKDLKVGTKEGAYFQMYNQYGYAIAIQLDFGKKDKTQDIQIGETQTIFSPSGVQLLVELSNPNAEIIKKRDFQYIVTDEHNKEMFRGSEEELKLAPMTKINYPIFWKNKLKEGKYKVSILLKDEGGKNTSKFDTKQIKVEQKNINQYVSHKGNDKNEVVLEKTVIPLWVWISFGIFAFIFIFMIVVIKKIKEKNK